MARYDTVYSTIDDFYLYFVAYNISANIRYSLYLSNEVVLGTWSTIVFLKLQLFYDHKYDIRNGICIKTQLTTYG